MDSDPSGKLLIPATSDHDILSGNLQTISEPSFLPHAGIWGFPRGNGFGGTAFTSYGAFWMSYATILIPGSGILASFTTPRVPPNLKVVGLVALFACLTVTFFLLAVGLFTGKVGVSKAGGAMVRCRHCRTAFIAYYVGFVDLVAAG